MMKVQVTELSKCKDCVEENQKSIIQGQDSNKQLEKAVRSWILYVFKKKTNKKHIQCQLLDRDATPAKKHSRFTKA